MNTKIYVSANYIYKVEMTGNEEKPLSITREYGRCRGNQWYAMDNKECPNVGLFIKNLGGVESVLAACKEVEDLSAWVEEHNAAAKEAHEKCHARAMAVQAEREAERRTEYERLFSGEVTETNEETVGALLRYLNTQNWGLWHLPKMTIGYICNQYDCDGKQATTIKLDQPIMVCGEPGTMFQVGAPIGHLTKYRRI
jgi:hypothetical protein